LRPPPAPGRPAERPQARQRDRGPYPRRVQDGGQWSGGAAARLEALAQPAGPPSPATHGFGVTCCAP
jgi:hypothetical protein